MLHKLCECGCGTPIVPQPFHKYKKQPVRFIKGHFQQTREFRDKHSAFMLLKPPEGFAPTGLCECGCGEKTPIATQSNRKRGMFYGYPIRFIHGHSRRGTTGSASPRWNGGRRKDKFGYWCIRMPGHRLANSTGYLKEHRLIWEQANGRELLSGEDVHHIDNNKDNNDPSNLVAISKGLHTFLHNLEPERIECFEEMRKNPAVREKLRQAAILQWEKWRAKHKA